MAKQLKLNWETPAASTASVETADDSSGDPLCDAVQQLLDAYSLLELTEADFFRERLLEDVQKLAHRWQYLANKRVQGALEAEAMEDKTA